MSEKIIDPNELGNEIVEVLKTIFDPEIPVDIYELGLIYDVFVNEDYDVKVLMTLTTPNCPVADEMPRRVKEAVLAVDGVNKVAVDLIWDPPWDMSRMSDVARLELDMM